MTKEVSATCLAIILLIATHSPQSYASCESDLATFLNNGITTCLNNNSVYPTCVFDYEYVEKMFGTQVSRQIHCFRTCPGIPRATWGSAHDRIACSGYKLPSRASYDAPNPAQWCGSVIDADNQVLGEKIGNLNTNFSLNYFTRWSEGKVDDYTLRYQASGGTPRDDINSFDIDVIRDSVTVDTTNILNDAPNLQYNYVWNGLDSLGNPTLGAKNLRINIKENHPSVSFQIGRDIVVGSFKARLLGLGGWLPSNYAFYDAVAKKLYKGNGETRTVSATPYLTSQYLVAEADGSLVYIFDNTGRIIQTKTALLGTTILTFAYDPAGRLISISDAFSKTTTFNRNISGEFVSITAPNGKVSTVNLDGNGFLSSITNANNETHTLTYHGTNGLLKTFTKPGLQTSTFTYDAGGNLINDTHSGGYFLSLMKTINTSGLPVITVTTPMSRTTTSTLELSNGTNNRRTTVLPGGYNEIINLQEPSYARTLTRELLGVTDTLNMSPDVRFPNQAFYNQSRSISYPVGTRSATISRTLSLSNSSNPFSITALSTTTQFNSSANTKITTIFDPTTKKFTSSTPIGKTSETVIDIYERPISVKIGSNHAVALTYTDENLTKIQQDTRETNFTYDSISGFLASISNSLGHVTSFTYDEVGRVTSQTLPDTRAITYSYDANGKVSSVTPPSGLAHSFSHNSSELTCDYTPPTLLSVPFSKTFYSYNNDKQITQIERPDGQKITYNYNATNGRLTSYGVTGSMFTMGTNFQGTKPQIINWPGGGYTQFTYSGESIVNTTNASSTGMISQYAPTFFRGVYLATDVVSGGSGPSSTISYTYNNDEDLITAGSLNLTYNVSDGKLATTSIGSAGAVVTDLYTYNNFGEITVYRAKYGSNVIYELNLTRDGLGRISNKSELMNSVTNDFTYTFDLAGRLTQVDKNLITASTYTYDLNSNRNGGTIGTQPTIATYDTRDRLESYNVSSYSYNANGELTSKVNGSLGVTTSYTYDVYGNLKQVILPSTDIITYEVDALNRRIGKKVNGVIQKRWAYMDQYRIAAELSSTNTITKRFIYASKKNIPDYMIEGGITYRIISDQLGSLRLVVRLSDGAIMQRMNHDEFGRITEDTNPGHLPFGFAGGLYDNHTQLVRFGARDYDPETGRWTSKDPILFGGGDTNLYGYTFNDPVNFIDPSGLSCQYSQGSGSMSCTNSSGQQYYNQTGYSGTSGGRNNSSMQSHANIGPIPQGTYTAGSPRPGGHMGPNAIPLVPDFLTGISIRMMGRDPNSFYMHGNNATNDASSGCIILPPNRTNILPGEVINVGQ